MKLLETKERTSTRVLYVTLNAAEAAGLITDLTSMLVRDTHCPTSQRVGGSAGCFSTTTGDGRVRLVVAYEPPLREPADGE